MDGQTASAVDVGTSEDARLESLGYKPQLNRVLGFFSNFAVGFTYLSPMVGIYSLFVFGLGIAGPAYIWLTFIPLIGMLFVALVFGELASHYPVAGALFQYSKFTVGPRFGWFVGWFYGFALLITVAVILVVETKSLLLGESASPAMVDAIATNLVGPGVERIIHLRTMHLGPDELLIGAKLAMSPSATLADAARAIDDAEQRVRTAVPSARVIYLEPDVDRGSAAGAAEVRAEASADRPGGSVA